MVTLFGLYVVALLRKKKRCGENTYLSNFLFFPLSLFLYLIYTYITLKHEFITK